MHMAVHSPMTCSVKIEAGKPYALIDKYLFFILKVTSILDKPDFFSHQISDQTLHLLLLCHRPKASLQCKQGRDPCSKSTISYKLLPTSKVFQPEAMKVNLVRN